MVVNEEVEALIECVFHGSGPEPLEERFYLDELQECGENRFDDPTILRGLKRDFSVHKETVCTRCSPEQLSKYCHGHSESSFEEREYWQIHPENIMQRWIDWVRDEEIFQSVDDPERLDNTRWRVSCTFESGPVRFHIFMSKSELDSFNFDRETPEFGVAFLSPRLVEQSTNSDRTYSWSEVLREGFPQDFRQTREELFGSFGDRLLSTEDFQTSKPLIEDSLREYFNTIGYSRIENNVGANCPEARRYELDVSAYGDFVAIESDTEKVVACECDVVNDYHLHRFSDSQLVSASGADGVDELSHLIGEMRTKATQRAALTKRINDIQTFVSLSTGVAAVAAILSLFNNISQFASFLTGLFGGTPISKGLSYSFLAIAIAAIIFIAILVALSLFWEYRFDWSVKTPGDQPN